MGKTRPPERSKLAKKQKKLQADKKRKNRPAQTPEQLLVQATVLLQQSDIEPALQLATSALEQLKETLKSDEDVIRCLPALNLLGEINVELGDIDAAREYFSQAAQIDEDGDIPEEQGGGSDKFMWLAQLSEEGGLDSVKWFEQGAKVLRQELDSISEEDMDTELEQIREEKRSKLATALCAIAEIYMTDLSWEDDKAEEVCNRVMEEAIVLAPNNPETLQTLASVRISQLRREEAQQHLRKSLELWEDLPEDSPDVPDFPVRISLARLLMEAGMEEEALEVLERLVQEDDHSVEAWYLGGWCLHLLAEKQSKSEITNGHGDAQKDEQPQLLRRSRRWLLRCMKLFDLLDYEDEKLHDHATELITSLNKVLGEPAEDEADAESGIEDDWEDDEQEDEDDVMEGV